MKTLAEALDCLKTGDHTQRTVVSINIQPDGSAPRIEYPDGKETAGIVRAAEVMAEVASNELVRVLGQLILAVQLEKVKHPEYPADEVPIVINHLFDTIFVTAFGYGVCVGMEMAGDFDEFPEGC